MFCTLGHEDRYESPVTEFHFSQFERDYLDTVDFVRRTLNRHRVLVRPVPVRRICRENDIRIIETNLSHKHASHTIEPREILVRGYSEARKRFYIAQELGHFLLGKGINAISYPIFAGCLLIPHDWIMQEFGIASYPVLAQIYNVTGEVMRIRLEQLGLCGRVALPF